VVADSGVVVDDVEDDLDPRPVQVRTIVLNSCTCSPRVPKDA
jgi:hypothetical protein